MTTSRRELLAAKVVVPSTALWRRSCVMEAASTNHRELSLHDWERDPRNLIFVPRSTFDAKGAQGPCVVLHGEQWCMFYAGIGIAVAPMLD